MKYFLAILLALASGYVAFSYATKVGFENPYPVVCDLVANRIYIEDDAVVGKWKKTCLQRSRLVKFSSLKNLIIKDLNNVLGLLQVSHLEVYDSMAVKSIWTGEAQETGIEAEFVDSELVVFKVHPKSPADAIGIKKGDIIISINGEQPNPWEAKTISGPYVVKRLKAEMKLDIKATKIVRNEDLRLEELRKGIAHLEIPSFRADFYSEEKMKSLRQKLQGMNELIVDLRGNIGGNFVAGLRLLSLFICTPEEVGRLVRPRAETSSHQELPNDLDDEKQIAVLNQSKAVLLKTFSSSECYQGKVSVLVDGGTASVAEMVAQALKEFRKALIMGSPSRGQLLVGVWYPVPEIGPGVEISIPEAIYVSRKEHRIEGLGVELDKILYYNIDEMQSGIDSWVKKALD